MLDDLRLPIGFKLADNVNYKGVIQTGLDWQIVETDMGTRALITEEQLSAKWLESGLIGIHNLKRCSFGKYELALVVAGKNQQLSHISKTEAPLTKVDALAFAVALSETRKIYPDNSLEDAIYAEKLSRLLPTYGISTPVTDDVLFGFWLSGGVNVSVKSIRRLRQLVATKFTVEDLIEIIKAGGYDVNKELVNQGDEKTLSASRNGESGRGSMQDAGIALKDKEFILHGRPKLTKFFTDHVIDVVRNYEQYKVLGINFPSAIVLHGLPGTGKTFAVEQLTEFLGWPSYNIDSSSIGSPYIHETGKKIAEVFDSAMENSPSVLVIDEMEAFLSSREMSGGHHRVEELAEFLRRIPEATKNNVLIISMTNRIDMIDAAILRRGRFDHILEVGYAEKEEVQELIEARLLNLPTESDVNASDIAERLAGRPLSDIDFVLRESARLAVRHNKKSIDQSRLLEAIDNLYAIKSDTTTERKIGFT